MRKAQWSSGRGDPVGPGRGGQGPLRGGGGSVPAVKTSLHHPPALPCAKRRERGDLVAE